MPIVEWAGALKRLLEVLGSLAPSLGLRSGGVFGQGHYLLPTTLLILLVVTAMVGPGSLIIIVPITMVSGSLALGTEVAKMAPSLMANSVATSSSSHVICEANARVHG